MSLLYSMPGLIALAGKLLIFILYRGAMQRFSAWFLTFFGFMFATNIVELAILNHTIVNVNGYTLILTYYFFAISAALSLFAFALELNQVSTKRIFYVAGTMYLIAQGSLLSGHGIAGYEDIGYSLTRVAGEYYWLIQVVLGSCFFAIMYTLRTCYTEEKTPWLCKQRALILFASLMPVLVAMTFVLIAMQVGAKINATVILSLFSTIMIGVIVFTESTKKLSLFMSRVPGNDLYKINKKINELADNGARLQEIGELQECFVLLHEKHLLGDPKDIEKLLAKKYEVSEATIKRRLKQANKIIKA